MRQAKILGAVLFLAGGACMEVEDAEIGPIAEPSATVAVPVPAVPAPAHGGTVLMAGQRPIEVVTHQAGTISAYHLGTAPTAPEDALVTVRVPDAEGLTRPVLLSWDPNESRYTGRLPGAQPVPGPLELVYVLGSETARATTPTFVLIKPVRAAVAVVGTPGAVAPVLVDGPSAPGVVVQAPSAPPPPPIIVPSAPQVVVHAPPPPPSRIVVAPRPPAVVAPPPPRVVVRPARPQPRVVVRPARPQPRVMVRRAAPPRVGRRPPPRRSTVRRPPPPRGRRPGYGPMGPGARRR